EWLGVILGHRCGGPQLLPYPTPVADRFYFIDRADGIWEEMKQEFLLLRHRELPPERAREAAEGGEDFYRTKEKAAYFKLGSGSPLQILRPNNLARRISRVPYRLGVYFQNGTYDAGTHHGTNPLEPVWENLIFPCRHFLAERLLFDRKPVKGKYVY